MILITRAIELLKEHGEELDAECMEAFASAAEDCARYVIAKEEGMPLVTRMSFRARTVLNVVED